MSAKYKEKVKRFVDGGFLEDHYSFTDSLGFIFENNRPSQEMFYATVKSSQYHQRNYRTEISFFVDKISLPFIWPQAALFNTADIVNFRGTLVTSNLSMINILARSNAAKRLFYVYDLLPLLELKEKRPEEFVKFSEFLKMNRILAVGRTNEYVKIIESYLGWPVSNVAVPDYNIDKFKEIK